MVFVEILPVSPQSPICKALAAHSFWEKIKNFGLGILRFKYEKLGNVPVSSANRAYAGSDYSCGVEFRAFNGALTGIFKQTMSF